MAKLKILKDPVTGESFYPYTHEKAITDDNGNEVIAVIKDDLVNLKGDLSKLSNEKIDNPSTGSVGQIIEIESVDEKGKPKTYKAVNKPTSSGEVSYEQISSAVSEYMAANPIDETDPTVPGWAKNPTKPTYTASEVGALPDTTKIPSKPSDLQNDRGFLTEHQVNNLIDAKLTGVETLLGGGF